MINNQQRLCLHRCTFSSRFLCQQAKALPKNHLLTAQIQSTGPNPPIQNPHKNNWEERSRIASFPLLLRSSEEEEESTIVPPPYPSSSTTSSIHMSQFLDNVLSHRGADALPYAEDTKWLIRQHILSLVEVYPSLVPKTSHFTHNDGRTVNLLQADGTIPVLFAGIVYNFPATIWLVENYPRMPPSVYLTPTRDMVVKTGHPHVDRSGHTSVPYLQSWLYPSSNLVDLVRSLSDIFGNNPPLYSRLIPPAASNRNPYPRPGTLQSGTRTPLPTSSSSSYSVSPYGGKLPPSQQHHLPTEDPSELFKRTVINKIVENVHGDVVDLRKKADEEMDWLFGVQAELKQREETLTRGLRDMQDEKEALEQQLQLVLMNTDILEGWFRDNEEKMKGWISSISGEVNVDDFFVVTDGLSGQLLECTSVDLAIEDTVYVIDKALQDGAVPFDKYLKSVRAMSRSQFFLRATAAKVRAAKVQMQVSDMAARVTVPTSYASG